MIISRLAIAGLLFCAVALSACAAGDASQRVEARTGQVVLDSEMDQFNFSIDLPEGWEAREWFQWRRPGLPATGWIELPATRESDPERVYIHWAAYDNWDDGVLAVARQEENVIVEETDVEGVRLRILYPDTSKPEPPKFRSVGAVFDSLPDAPDGTPAIPLSFRASVFPDDQIETIIEMFKSVRYEEPNPPPEPLVKAVSPGPDWINLQPADFEGYAQGRSPRFAVSVPPGTTARVFPLYDTIGVALQVGELTVSGGRGQADIIFGPPDPKAGVTIWRTQVADVLGYFWQTNRDDGSFDLGVYYPAIPAMPDKGVPNPLSTALTLVAEAIPEDAQAEVLAVLESVRYAE